MTAYKGKTDFMQGFNGESEETQAYREVLGYLVEMGRYDDVVQADNDASERVKFCEEIGLYADDARLKNASVVQRKLQALIHANKLHDVITENGGYLPTSNTMESARPMLDAGNDGVLPEIYPVSDYSDQDETGHNEGTLQYLVSNDRARFDDDTETAEPVIETVISVKENTFLHLTRYLSTVLGIVAVLLAASRFIFDSDALLQITKYSFLLFILLLLVIVSLSEVSGRLMKRLRYAVSYLFLLATGTLSGLLFLQQPWAETTFYLRGGAMGMIVNFLIHRVIAIGPFWLGVFFAVTTLILLFVTWFAGRELSDD
jgi:ABC-type multidrug transport system fused ATPase/permease subunit